MPSNPGPMVSRRRLGAALRQHRLDAGKSVGQVAEHLMCHSSKISRLESAQRTTSPRDVRALLDFYGIADTRIRDRLIRLARESRESAWWQGRNISPAFARYYGLEGSAARISEYQITAVPGLLQTRDYATAMLRMWEPDDPLAVEEAVHVRMMRQEHLADGVLCRFIVDEAVLRRVVGTRVTMRGQLDHLIELAATPLLSLQVIPFEAGAHRGMASGFTILEFETHGFDVQGPSASDVVHIEGIRLSEVVSLEKTDDVGDYLRIFEMLRGIALTAEHTVAFLKAVCV